MRKFLVLLTALAAMIIAGCGGGEYNVSNTGTNNANAPARSAANSNANASPGNNNASSANGLSSGDREFMTEAATGGMEEVELGRLAAQKAQSPDVKKFGQRMVDDHSKAGDELKQLATRKGVTLPTDMTDKQKADKEKLSKLAGAAFDKEYMSMMVDDHDKDVKEFQIVSASSSGDADVKAFATKTLPTLEEHQRMAKEIKGKQ